ncbi:hypothetical protein [Bifidobacterium pseudolongum]|uniref:hypothetical protein n=1 Tax=Bifidobacterium pseudolongum TaxID=1694 RepID=UPI001021EAD0|nr:hypothetical protein [Bifidobacterium pseudolongum]RYQ43022.1 hypothetical protein PG1805B_0228 [Bifidobacterium pseudolongum subsp. globosum]
MIATLRMLLSALAAQLMGTVREVEANSTVAVVKVQALIRVMDFVTAALFAAKRGNDTPAENEQILAQLESQLTAFERDTRTLVARGAHHGEARHEIAAGAVAQLRAVSFAAQVEEMTS